MNTASTTPKLPVKIYVRLVNDDESQRQVSFRLRDGLDALDLLDRGFALDGNQAAFTIRPVDTGEGIMFQQPVSFGLDGGDELYETLTEALAAAQRSLVKYIRERGFEPQFA